MNLDGSDLTRLTGEKALAGKVGIGQTTFSPTGEAIVYIFYPLSKDKVLELWSAQLDGAGTKRLVGIENLSPFFNLESEPKIFILPMTWIPETDRLLFSPYLPDGTGRIYDPLMWVDVRFG